MKRLKKKYLIVLLIGVLSFVVVPVALAWPFSDVPVGYWAYEQIRRIASIHITSGCGGGKFCPEGYVTRSQMAVFMDNFTKAYTTEDEPFLAQMDHQDIALNRPAIVGKSADGTGLVGQSYGAGVADNGVSGSTISTDPLEAGVFGSSTSYASGVIGYNSYAEAATATSFGLRAFSAHGHGLFADGGAEAGDYGGYFVGYNGVLSDAASGHAFWGNSNNASNAAAVFDADGWNGVYAHGSSSGSGGGRGVWAESNTSYGVFADTFVAGGYGVYTNDKIYAGGGCVGCTAMLVAMNASQETLQPGDLVAVVGIAEGPSSFSSVPVLSVMKADLASAENVIGVVGGRYVSEVVTRQNPSMTTTYVEIPDPELEKNGASAREPDLIPVPEVTMVDVVVEEAYATTEPAAPGEKMTIIYRGLAQVRVDASTHSIAVGDMITSADTVSGLGMKAPSEAAVTSTIFGKALEALPDGQGLIWVLVDLD